jgi:hypothetical protein
VSDADQSKLLDPLAEFMKVVENIKANSFVHALQIESFELTPQWGKDDYSDAIVNIFTRLNTAGRTLTREEITLAWLKVGWVAAETDGKTAGQCLDELKSSLVDSGFHLETDEIVRLISFIWSVEHRDGNLLDSKDLLKGEIVRSMATSVASTWNQLKLRLVQAAELIKERDLLENQGSFNAIIVFFCWYRLVFDRFEAISACVQVVERDSIEKQLNQRATRFLDRWVFGSQWANVWGDAAVVNFQNFATDLNFSCQQLSECSVGNLIATVDDAIAQLMGRVSGKATEQVNNAVVKDRRRVYGYYSLLWVWHRLNEARWKYSSVPMRTGRKRKSKLEVDHTVADAWWGRLVDHEIETKRVGFVGSDDERSQIAPDGFESVLDARAFINLLGNCSLLDKSFNISKSDAPMWTFLQAVHEFENGEFERHPWEEALSLSEILTAPDGSSLAELKNAIQTRDISIRKELTEFIAGNRHRLD